MSIDDTRRRDRDGSKRVGRAAPPHNLQAEISLVGAALLSRHAFEVAVTEVDTDDFYSMPLALTHAAMKRLWDAGITNIDPVIVGDELAARNELDAIGGCTQLMEWQSKCPATSNARRYARIVVEHATMRKLGRVGIEIADLAYDGPVDIREAVDQAKYLVSQVDLPVEGGTPSLNAMQFLEVESDYDWLIEGLLERRDRLIITGPEGGGKSTLMRQLALMFAAGMHPFNFQRVTPVRVLVVDVENSSTQIQRALAPMIDRVKHRLNPENLRLELRTDGLDLTHRHDSRWLLERVASNRPDVLITGPLYKLHAEDPNDEQSARRVARVFDMIRAKFDCAIVLEAHAPHGVTGARSLRPFGSSLWLRWPEFGYGMVPDGEAGEIDGRPLAVWWRAWRGPRDQRKWPIRLSGDGREFWPWRDSSHRVHEEAF